MNKPVRLVYFLDDRDIPKKPIKDPEERSGMGYEYHDWVCPKCMGFLAFEPDIRHIPKRCQKCGQEILMPEE